MAMVRAAVARTPGAVLIDRPMPREEAQALQEVCDSFVSLHRAEGFGLNIAEAMLLKKPVIVTAWSGNMEFTTQANSCLVDAPLVRLTADHGPYPRGSRWAEPDLDQAAAHMRTLVEDGRLRSRIAARGHETVVAELSPAAVGARYRRRLDLIRRRRRGAILTP
jgi:glycosyltransferase involved in cell wall biosynthesis